MRHLPAFLLSLAVVFGGAAQCQTPVLQPPDAPATPTVAPPLVTEPAPVVSTPFAIDVRDDRFPITTETVNGEPVRCVRLPVNDKLRLKASGAIGKSVTWRIHPPSPNFDSYELGQVADLTLPPMVNAVVIAATISEDGQTAVVDTLLVVSTQGPQPPPVVVVPPVVDPSVPPAPPVVVDPNNPPPIPAEGFRALLLFEARKGMPDSYAAPAVNDYLNSHCVKSVDGVLEWRRPDITDNLAGDYDTIQAMRAIVPDGVENWIVCGNGKTGYSGAPPDDDPTGAKLLALLKKYGGA